MAKNGGQNIRILLIYKNHEQIQTVTATSSNCRSISMIYSPQNHFLLTIKKKHYIGLDYVGVRAQESIARSEYEYENYGKKQKGQYSHNSILEWTSAEVWLYMFANNLLINETYKKTIAAPDVCFAQCQEA
jgi:3'-phosphoadenosine 5'-phosphosulfate sulfotransferase (PAPS reductase)/FAD synthetase